MNQGERRRRDRDRGTVRRRYLDLNGESLADIARRGYAREGRGAVLVLPDDGAPAPIGRAGYLSDATLRIVGTGWPDAWVEGRVKAYDPACEAVALFLYGDGALSVHRTRWPDPESMTD
jgi:hypothetical protein